MYLSEENGLEKLPSPIQKQLGEAEFAMSLELSPERKLGQENVEVVMNNLEKQGFHLQMPREIEDQLAEISKAAMLKKHPSP